MKTSIYIPDAVHRQAKANGLNISAIAQAAIRNEVLGLHESVTVRPGDTLILRCEPSISHERADYVRVFAEERLPDVKVIVIAAEQLAVYQAGASDGAR